MDGTAPPQLESDTLAWAHTPDTDSLMIYVTGTPKPKARPRTVRNPHTGFTHTYTPSATVTWEQTIVVQVKAALARITVEMPEALETLPFTGRIIAEMTFYVNKPASAPRTVKYPLKAKPGDIDNLAKSVLDAMQLAGVIQDDKTVTDLFTSKRFSDDGHPEGVYVNLTLCKN